MSFDPKTQKYTPPSWSPVDVPKDLYNLEVMEGGVILDQISLAGQPFFSIGRSPENDIVIEARGVSRHHLIL